MHLRHMPRVLEIAQVCRSVTMWWGDKGIGKSAGVWQYCQAKDIGLVDLRLGGQESGDLVGIPRARELKPGYFAQVSLCPEWMPTDIKVELGLFPKVGCVFLDEFNRASQDVLQGMFKFILGTKNMKTGETEFWMHSHKLAKGWFIVCAGNPDIGDYQVQPLDPSMLDRFVHLHLEKDQEGASLWMRKNLKEPAISEYVAKTRGSIGEKSKYELLVDISPRSWELLDNVLEHLTEEDFKNIALELIIGCIGDVHGSAFFKDIQDDLLRAVPGQEIIETDDFEKLYETKLKRFCSSEVKRVELLNITIHDILDWLGENEPSEKNSANIMNFVNVIPPDQRINLLKKLTNTKQSVPLILEMSKPERRKEIFSIFGALGIKEDKANELLAKMKSAISQARAADQKGN